MSAPPGAGAGSSASRSGAAEPSSGSADSPLVSLKEAREKAFLNRKLAREGGDSLSEKRRAESMPTFEETADKVWRQLRPGWRSDRHAQVWLNSLERHVFPRIGEMPVSEVTSADVIGILAPMWHEKPALARKLRQRMRAVMEWALAMGLRPDNPCDRIGPVLGVQGNRTQHLRARRTARWRRQSGRCARRRGVRP